MGTLLLSLALLQGGPHGCNRGPGARAFDFWVGSWIVQTPEGKRVGQSQISHGLEGCALVERFRGADGEGTSLSTYSSGSRRWEMLFANTSGLVVHQQGVPVAGGLRFTGTGIRTDGTRQGMRTTFTALADSGVRQVLELSDDGGASWHEVGVAIYLRRPEPAPS